MHRRTKFSAFSMRGKPMLDLIYIALGLVGFAAFGLAVRAAERM
jgi:hypothetical protein